MTQPPKRRVNRTFNAKAGSYESCAPVQRRIAHDLVQMIGTATSSDQLWLDCGCGTGNIEEFLSDRRIIALDQAVNALAILAGKGVNGCHVVAADMESMPFCVPVFDGILSATALQWIPDHERFLASCTGLLKPGGIFAAAVLCPGTLQELTDTQHEFGIPTPVTYSAPESFLTNCGAAGLEIVTARNCHFEQDYDSAHAFLRSLSAIGSTAHQGRPLHRTRIKAMCTALENRFKDIGHITARYEVLLVIAAHRPVLA